MKIKMIICSALAASLVGACVSEQHERDAKLEKQAKLMAQAKVNKDDALKTALADVPNGVMKEAELEKEHGKLIWSFDLATPDSKDITEVNVDAITGTVVSTHTEAPDDHEKD